jgi:hypothetical protein
MLLLSTVPQSSAPSGLQFSLVLYWGRARASSGLAGELYALDTQKIGTRHLLWHSDGFFKM